MVMRGTEKEYPLTTITTHEDGRRYIPEKSRARYAKAAVGPEYE